MLPAKCQPFRLSLNVLTHKQLEMHGWILNIVATDDLVLKPKAISIYSAE